MKNQNRKFRPPVLSIIQGIGGEGELDVCQCPLYHWCTCQGTPVCWCSGDHTKADDTNAVDAVEQSKRVVVKQSNDIEDHDEAMINTAPALEARLPVGDEDRIIKNHHCINNYEVVPTNSANNLCGIFALEISTESQLGRRLTQPEFWRIMNSPEVQEFNARKKWAHVTENFYDEQLAIILRIWGRSFPGLHNLQLGIILQGNENAYILCNNKIFPVFPGGDMEGEQGFTTVWIHNDNAQEGPGFKLNHYSGITILGEDSLDTKSSTEEASGTESGDDTEAEEKEESPEENSPDTLETGSSKEMGDGMDTDSGDESPWRVLPTSYLVAESSCTERGSDVDMTEDEWVF